MLTTLLPLGHQARQHRTPPWSGLTHEELNDALALWWRKLHRRYPRPGLARAVADRAVQDLLAAIL